MQVLMIGLGLGGTAVADRVMLEQEHFFANVMIYEIYRAIIEGPEEGAKCYVGQEEKKVRIAEKIAMEALRPEIIVRKDEDKKYFAGLDRPFSVEKEKDLNNEIGEIKKRIREEKLPKEQERELIEWVNIIHEKRRKGPLIEKREGNIVHRGTINAFVNALEEIAKQRKYIDVLLLNTSRQDKATIMENQKKKARIGINILGKPVELSRFDAFRIKEEDYILFGEHITHGGGAGWDNTLGLKMAAQEEELFSKIIRDRLKTKALEGRAAMIVAVVYGSGGGTGSGAAPVVCKAVKDLRREDVRVIAFALLPSKEECRMRAYNSVTSLAFTSEMVTGLGTMPIEDYIKPGLPLREAYEEADENFARFFVLMAGAEELPQIKNDIKNKIIDLLER
jgi:hypothetical protein